MWQARPATGHRRETNHVGKQSSRHDSHPHTYLRADRSSFMCRRWSIGTKGARSGPAEPSTSTSWKKPEKALTGRAPLPPGGDSMAGSSTGCHSCYCLRCAYQIRPSWCLIAHSAWLHNSDSTRPVHLFLLFSRDKKIEHLSIASLNDRSVFCFGSSMMAGKWRWQ